MTNLDKLLAEAEKNEKGLRSVEFRGVIIDKLLKIVKLQREALATIADFEGNTMPGNCATHAVLDAEKIAGE